jgi:hypothetical protein
MGTSQRSLSFLTAVGLSLAAPAGAEARTARVRVHNGAPAIVVDNVPITGLSWNALCAQLVPSHIKAMTATDGSSFKLSRVLFVLGRDVYQVCSNYPFDRVVKEQYDGLENPKWTDNAKTHTFDDELHETWNGDSKFDWAFLDHELNRRIAADPKTLVILQVALDGARLWEGAHSSWMTKSPFGGDFSYVDVPHPDYVNRAWKNSTWRALGNLVRHIRGKYSNHVIGYELFNGPSLDTNSRMDPITPSGVAHFRSYLRSIKYKGNVSQLRAAWGDPSVDFDRAAPQLATDPASWATSHEYAPLFVPSSNQRRADTREYVAWAEEEVVRDFARFVKVHTGGQAIVGARFGEALYGCWYNHRLDDSWSAAHALVHYRTRGLYSDPNIDFFEVWDPYGQNRLSGYQGGSSAPTLPIQGLAARNKLYIIQNDFRTYGATPESFGYRERNSDGTKGFLFDLTKADQAEPLGYAPSFVETLAKQRRVFVSALVNGMNEWLWEMSYPHSIPSLMPEWRRHEDVFKRSLNKPRGSVAEVVYVVDPELGKYFVDSIDLNTDTNTGLPRFKARVLSDPNFHQYDGPSVAQYLIQYPMNAWAKAGVPYDMIFLDQLQSARKYKVYVFFHTLSLSRAQIDKIHGVLASNNAIGIFAWADGLMDEAGRVPSSGGHPNVLANPSYLTGMTITGDHSPQPADLLPAPTFLSRWPALSSGRPSSSAWLYPVPNTSTDPANPSRMYLYPSFRVAANPGDTVAATYMDGWPAVVTRQMPGWVSIYSGSPYIPPPLIRYALSWAGGTVDYIDTSDNLYLNQSFLGLNTAADATGTIRTRPIHLSLPDTQVLHSVLPDPESDTDGKNNWGTDAAYVGTTNVTDFGYTGTTIKGGRTFYEFTLQVKDNRTYLFYRGSSRDWLDAK